jgi:hypothetical protein
MKGLNLGRYALCSCIAATMLAGCGGLQPPIGAVAAVRQTWAMATHAARGGSWMLRGAKGAFCWTVADPASSTPEIPGRD